MRTVALVLLGLVTCLAATVAPVAAARSFPETGYAVTNDKILDYFDHRGGAQVLGYPISREFQFKGAQVQLFQRAALQIQPDGNVGLLNLLDEGLLPYTEINGSAFPAADPTLEAAAPSPSDPDYGSKAIQFVQAYAPNDFDGLPVQFYNTFANTVSYQEAFPNGGGDPSLMPLIDLEIWGLPTSRPAYDPRNHNFVYQRFQRGIMHYDRTSGTTQGILLGDYLKSVITGQNLPADLAAEASGSALYRQYDNNNPLGLARPEQLPATNMFAAFEKEGVVVPAPAPAPAATPVAAAPPAPAPTAAPQPPANIEVDGPPQFVNVVNWALQLLQSKTPDYYSVVKQNVYKITLLPAYSTPYIDFAAHAIDFDEPSAYVTDWAGHPDQQTEWLAGMLVHNAVIISRYYQGLPTTGTDAERQALQMMQNVLGTIDTTDNPSYQFRDYVKKALDGNPDWFSDFQTPPGPKNP